MLYIGTTFEYFFYQQVKNNELQEKEVLKKRVYSGYKSSTDNNK